MPAILLLDTPFKRSTIAWLERDGFGIVKKGAVVVPLFVQISTKGMSAEPLAGKPVSTDMDWFFKATDDILTNDIYPCPPWGTVRFETGQWDMLHRQPLSDWLNGRDAVLFKLRSYEENKMAGTRTFGFVALQSDLARYQP